VAAAAGEKHRRRTGLWSLVEESNPPQVAGATAILMEPTGHRIPLSQNLLAAWRMIRGVHEMPLETGQADG
jgi:hypothetical protein